MPDEAKIEAQIELLVESIATKDDFRRLLFLLVKDADKNLREWDNDTIERYLHGMLAWFDAMEGYYRGRSMEIDTNLPSWRIFADLLLAARVYE